MDNVNNILNTIQDAVDKLSTAAQRKEDPVYKKVIELLHKLQTRDGALLNNIENMNVISEIKTKIERLIIDKDYKDQIKEFASAYTDIANLQNQYFSQFAATFKPPAALNILKKAAIEATVTSLAGVGIESGLTDGIKKILLTNVQGGGSLSDLSEQLREHIKTTDTPGALEKYVRAYSTTAVSQYSREYGKSISDDLGLEWYLYTGSLIETSREFCIKAVAKKYIHASEFEALLRGDFGAEGKIHVSKSTGLPPGLIDGTNPDNFIRLAGGWNCPHVIVAVADSVVPQTVQNEVYSTTAYEAWSIGNNRPIKKPLL